MNSEERDKKCPEGHIGWLYVDDFDTVRCTHCKSVFKRVEDKK